MNEKKSFLYSIKAKLIFGFVVISLISMAIATTYAVYSFDKYVGDEFSKKLLAKLNNASLFYDLKEKNLINLARSISNENIVKSTLETGPREQLADYISGILLRQKDLDVLTIVDNKGVVVARGTNFSLFEDDLSGKPLVRSALRSPEGKITIGTEIVSSQELEKEGLLAKASIKKNGHILESGLMIKSAVPIYFENKLIGAAILGSLLNNNSRITEEIKKGVGADVHILEKNIVISSTFGKSQENRILGEELDISNENFSRDLIKKISIGGENYLFAFHFLKNIQGKITGAIAISTNVREMAAIKNNTRDDLLLISLISIVLVVILSLYVSHVIVVPIHKTIEAMVSVSNGDFSQKIKEKRQDETGKLIESFNKMTENLRKSQSALEEAKAVLEIKVQARTKELRELADSLEEKVKQRTKELQKRVDDLERFHRLTVGRELKMIELKKEIKKLRKQKS